MDHRYLVRLLPRKVRRRRRPSACVRAKDEEHKRPPSGSGLPLPLPDGGPVKKRYASNPLVAVPTHRQKSLG
jgi:hypothetical protein